MNDFSIIPAINDTVISSRIRFARNLESIPFPYTLLNMENGRETGRDIIRAINKAINKVQQFNLYFIENLSGAELALLQEQYLISKDLMENSDCGAVFINQNESVSIMVNEEDHIREQGFAKGLQLEKVYKELSVIDNILISQLPVAFDNELGFLTACPTNLGTAMRASVMLFLPALTLDNKIAAIAEFLEKRGITIRGGYGEGSSADGFMYQLSNMVSLGYSEEKLIQVVLDNVTAICNTEYNARQMLYEENKTEITDKCLRAFGVLTNAYKIDTAEFISLISYVKLGCYLGIIKLKNNNLLDDLIVSIRPAHINKLSGRDLNPQERDICRAEHVRNTLSKLKV